MFYRDYERFDQKKFEIELKLRLNSQTNLNYSTFQAVFLEILNETAPVKVKVLRFNNNAIMTTLNLTESDNAWIQAQKYF